MPRNTKSATGKPASGTGRSTATASRKTATTTASYSEETKLKELFVEELKDIYWAEKHLVKALPKHVNPLYAKFMHLLLGVSNANTSL